MEGGQCGQYVYLPRTRFQGPYCRVCYEKKTKCLLYYRTIISLFFEFRAIKGGLVGFTWHYIDVERMQDDFFSQQTQ